MKKLTDYIKENQIEEGLISDIIMKLLDTGISWIDKTFAFIGDGIKYASKTVVDDISTAVMRDRKTAREIYGTDKPKEIYKEITKNIYTKDAKSHTSRKENFEQQLENFKKLTKDERDGKMIEHFECEGLFKACMFTMNDKNSSEQDKKSAEMDLMYLKKKYPNLLKKFINKDDTKYDERTTAILKDIMNTKTSKEKREENKK